MALQPVRSDRGTQVQAGQFKWAREETLAKIERVQASLKSTQAEAEAAVAEAEAQLAAERAARADAEKQAEQYATGFYSLGF